METAKIYIWDVRRAVSIYECGPKVSLYPWGKNTATYEGSDDGGQYYILPDGFEQREHTGGTIEIFDERGNACPLALLEGINGPHRIFIHTIFGSMELLPVSTQIGYNPQTGITE